MIESKDGEWGNLNLISFCDSFRQNNMFGLSPTSSSFTNQHPEEADQKVQCLSKHIQRRVVILEQRRVIGYIGGIRPNKLEPLICSFTNKAAILMAFLTPDLQFTFQNIQQFDKKQVTKKKVEIRATWNSSNGTKDPRMTIHKTSITFHVSIFCQIRASSSICARIVLRFT